MPRRSTRAHQVTYTESGDVDAIEVDANEVNSRDDDEFVAPVKKARARKRKTPQDNEDKEGTKPVKRPRKKRGLLKDLVEMPLDILFEIFGHLDPLDLVHTARTTKTFRAVLMDSSSKSVWRSARSNIEGLPDCPSDLSEPQYAVLVFAKYCSFCQRSLAAVHISWTARVRCCNKCLQIHFDPLPSAPSVYWTGNRGYPSLLASWLPILKLARHTGRRNETKSWYAFSKVDCTWKEEYEALKVPQIKFDWLNQRLEERYAIEKHARECELWWKTSQGLSAEQTYSNGVAERKLEVMQYVKELGLGDELYKVNPMVTPHPLDETYVEEVCRFPITEATLLRLKPLLTNYIQELKAKREFAELEQLFQTRHQFLCDVRTIGAQELPANKAYPNALDIHELGEKHGFIDYSKSPADALSVPFTEIVAMWQLDIDTKLIELITRTCGSDYVFTPTKVLDLATVFFDCSMCNSNGTSMGHERTLMHECATSSPWLSTSLSTRLRALQKVFSTAPWCSRNENMITFGKEQWMMMTRVVEMAGLDPKTATAEEMDGLNLVFECRTCNDIDLGRATMTWAAVRNHNVSQHGRTIQSMDLRIINGPDADKARERIREEQIRRIHGHLYKLICVHCHDQLSCLKDYRHHLKEKHGKTKVTYNELRFYIDQNRTPPVYRLWPPLDVDESEDEL